MGEYSYEREAEMAAEDLYTCGTLFPDEYDMHESEWEEGYYGNFDD